MALSIHCLIPELFNQIQGERFCQVGRRVRDSGRWATQVKLIKVLRFGVCGFWVFSCLPRLFTVLGLGLGIPEQDTSLGFKPPVLM